MPRLKKTQKKFFLFDKNINLSGEDINGIIVSQPKFRYNSTLICLVPEFMMIAWNVQFYFGGTSLLIIVVVIMDFMAQVQTHLMSHQYESVLKKANLKGYGR